jgi:hypothetical protein
MTTVPLTWADGGPRGARTHNPRIHGRSSALVVVIPCDLPGQAGGGPDARGRSWSQCPGFVSVGCPVRPRRRRSRSGPRRDPYSTAAQPASRTSSRVAWMTFPCMSSVRKAGPVRSGVHQPVTHSRHSRKRRRSVSDLITTICPLPQEHVSVVSRGPATGMRLRRRARPITSRPRSVRCRPNRSLTWDGARRDVLARPRSSGVVAVRGPSPLPVSHSTVTLDR